MLCLVVVVVLGAVVGGLMDLILGQENQLLENILLEALSIVLFGPLVTIPGILLYYDMRARKEGYGAAQLVEDLRI
jgi:hypothetical protein